MKPIYTHFHLLIILLLQSTILFAQDVNDLQNLSEEKIPAFNFELNFLHDQVQNMKGGIKQGSQYLEMANLILQLNTEAAGLWNEGTFFINVTNTAGGTPTQDFIGDFNGSSNIEAGYLTYLQEFWFSQKIDNLTLTAGLQDLNKDFVVSRYGGLLINSSFGIPSVITGNIDISVFPTTALGLTAIQKLDDNFSVQTAVYDGKPEDPENSNHNLNWNIRGRESFLSITELQYSNNIFNRLPGEYKIGYYYHGAENNTEDEEPSVCSNYGIYLIADQTMYSKSSGEEFGMFTQLAVSPQNTNTNCYYVGMGIAYHGLISGRINDDLVVAFAHSAFRNSITNGETALEFSYRAQINDNLFIQPDLQYIINPSGTNEKLNNALVGIIRLGLNI